MFRVEMRQSERREAAGNAAEAGADGVDVEMEEGDDRGVETCLGRGSGGDGKGHGERQSDQAHRDARRQIRGEFLPGVVPQRENGLRCPVGKLQNFLEYLIPSSSGSLTGS